MRTDTSRKILQFLKDKKEATPKELIDFLELKPRAVFKQLKKLFDKNLVFKTGKPPRVFYQIVKKQIFDVKIENLNKHEADIVNKNYLWISPDGEMVEGVMGFKKWCEKQNLPFAKTADEYVKTLSKYEKYKKNGIISGMYKMKTTFDKVWLDEIHYLDFYSIERFGKTKLGSLLLYAKQSQDLKLMKKIKDMIKTKIFEFVKKEKIDAVGFVPPTVKREIQFQKEMEKLLSLNFPKIKITKAISGVVVAQKTLSKLEDRIENARRTNFIEGYASHKKILLIDDAVGSGATMNEIAKKIKEKTEGTTKVIGLAITGSFKGFEVLNEV